MKPGHAAIGMMLWLTACSVADRHPDWVQPPPPEAVRQVLSGEALLGHPITEREMPHLDLHALTPVLVDTANELRSAHRSPPMRAKALHYRLMSPVAAGGHGIRYAAGSETLPPGQAFQAGEVNCLSYTLLYVAMARQMGLKAEVNDVRLPPAWDLRDRKSLMLMRHVNAKVLLNGGDELVIDLQMDRWNPTYPQSLVSGDLAEALFYSNRAMELLARGHRDDAFAYLRRALDLDDDKSYIWNNLGNLYFRAGHLDLAETAYLKGLRIEPADFTIMGNLHALYAERGQPERAAYFKARAAKYRERNPYYTYTRALAALDDGQLHEAEHLALAAIDKLDDEPRFYVLAAQVYERLGEHRKAMTMQRRADAIRKRTFL